MPSISFVRKVLDVLRVFWHHDTMGPLMNGSWCDKAGVEYVQNVREILHKISSERAIFKGIVVQEWDY